MLPREELRGSGAVEALGSMVSRTGCRRVGCRPKERERGMLSCIDSRESSDDARGWARKRRTQKWQEQIIC